MLKITRMMKIADLFTTGNFIAGVISIFLAGEGDLALASIAILAGVFFDFFDGRIARMTGTSNEFGKQLDSLADLTTFGVAPAVLGFQSGLDSVPAIIILIIFAVCGMLRLARFNTIKAKGFIGIPITTNGILFPALWLVFSGFSGYVTIIYAMMSYLMISDIKVKKL